MHVSTDEVYGSLRARRFDFTNCRPTSRARLTRPAKQRPTTLLTHRTRPYGLPVIVSNCSNNYGPYQFPEKLIPLTILNALEGKPLPVYGTGAHVRDWLFRRRSCSGLATLLERGKPGDKYSFGGDNERTNLTVVQLICDILDLIVPSGQPRRSLITFVTDRPGHDLRYAIDASHAHHQLGWRLRENFDSGLAHTIRWYLDHQEWWGPLRQSIYGGERLGLVHTTQ